MTPEVIKRKLLYLKKEPLQGMMHISKDKNIQAIINGDSEGLRKIYTDLLPRIRKLILRNGGQEEDAQDIFQSAILIIYEKALKDDFQLTSSFYTLLYGICRNLWGNRLQKKSFQEVTLPLDIKYKSDQNIEEELERVEEQDLFWFAFQQLGVDCQRLLRLFFEKEKMERIAQVMGYTSISYAKKKKFMCKEKLIKLVKADQRFEELKHHTR